MNILISGATGFIGKSVVESLSKKNNLFLVSRKTLKSSTSNINYLSYNDSDGFLNIDSRNIKKIDIVLHLATHFVSKHTDEDLPKLMNANLLLGIRLLELCTELNCKRFINISSFAQSCDGTTSSPQNLYAASKESFLTYLRFYSSNKKISVLNLEFFDSYGPNDKRGKFFDLALNAFLNKDEFKMSEGNQEICLIHINDIISAIKVSIDILKNNSGIHNFTLLNDSSKYKLKDLVLLLNTTLNSKSEIVFGHYPYRNNEIFKLKSRYSPLPGWSPEINLVDVVKKLI
jgi:CDP-paratose synthetase